MKGIDRETWLILAERLEVLRRYREAEEAWDVKVKLEFDENDQARVVVP